MADNKGYFKESWIPREITSVLCLNDNTQVTKIDGKTLVFQYVRFSKE